MFTIGQWIGIGIGAIAGGCVSARYFWRRRHANAIYRIVTYDNLLKFSETCKSRCPQIVKSRCVCELLEDGLYRVTQIMLDNQLIAVRSKDDVVGRIVMCRAIDDKVRVLCGNHFPGEFDFTV